MKLAEMKWTEVAALSRDTVVVIPVAACEQHGHHLPVFTDSMQLEEVCRRSEERLRDKVLFCPLMWLGNSEHHIDFAGTMTAAPRTYLDMIQQMTENLMCHGFKRFVVLNGHGGNIIPAQQAYFELRQKHRHRNDLLLASTTYWTLGSPGGKPHELHSDFKQDQVGHACEYETSMILRLAPHLVGEYKSLAPVSFGTGLSPAHRAWITKDRSAPGHIGMPHLANPEKGERLFQIFSGDVVKLLERAIAWDGKTWDL